FHRLAFASVGEFHDPAERERVLAVGGNFQRHLIRGTTDAAGLRLDARLGVVHGALEDFNGAARRILFRNGFERAGYDALRGALLAGHHDGVHEAGDERVVVFAVVGDGTLGGLTSAGHVSLFLKNYFAGAPAFAAFGFFTPYLERLTRRFSTPAASSVPR